MGMNRLARVSASMARQLGTLLDHRATIYTNDTPTGEWTNQVKTGLHCHLQPFRLGSLPPGDGREELTEMGTFNYDPTYSMPDNARLVVNVFVGETWNVVEGSEWEDVGPGNVIIMRHCELRRA